VVITNDNQVIVLHETPNGHTMPVSLASMLASEPLRDIVFNRLLSERGCDRTYLAVPAAWEIKTSDNNESIIRYDGCIPLLRNNRWLQNNGISYLVLSNGRFYANIDSRWLRKIVSSFNTDVTMVAVDPTLAVDQEKLRLTSQGQLAGIRRVYDNSAQRAPMPVEWPCYVFIRTSCLTSIFGDAVPTDFDSFLQMAAKTASVSSISVGGTLLDIETPPGLLTFATHALKLLQGGNGHDAAFMTAMPAGTRYYGEVVVGHNVRFGKNVQLMGRVIIGDNTDIGDATVIARAIISDNVSIAPNAMIHDQLLTNSIGDTAAYPLKPQFSSAFCRVRNNFRIWPHLSYARFFKRWIDIVVAAFVLLLFAPVIAIVAVIVKATSRGPIFFGHLRQGLHGKNFRCFKFRSMIVGADDLQQKLRVKNEVDGPQFKMDDDPRVTPVGDFLRDTYLDEIPQFFNVLLGQMSVIGPRPSPEAENSLCAYWRDARLSVRPGITGLWQVCRTRKTGSDFQEWVHYDSLYVRHLSLKLDMWICWKTTKYLVKTFLKQF
jgi:lipopolysaccharide/colanic/teichoic acid biosynthesis glycosyltransferase